MSERKSKFFGLVLFLILIIGFSYLMITGSNVSHKETYSQISISENYLLPAEIYLRYAGLSDSTKYNDLTLLDIKTKIEKHPYLRKAEVEFDGVSTILVEVEEKEMKAALLQKNEIKLITSDLETLPLFPPCSIEKLPVISRMNVKGNSSVDENGMLTAFRIIDALSYGDTNVSKDLAEINLRNGGDAILTFTGMQFPILFGKNDEIKKALILKDLWQKFDENPIALNNTEYIDLRYKNKVFIGKRKTELAGG